MGDYLQAFKKKWKRCQLNLRYLWGELYLWDEDVGWDKRKQWDILMALFKDQYILCSLSYHLFSRKKPGFLSPSPCGQQCAPSADTELWLLSGWDDAATTEPNAACPMITFHCWILLWILLLLFTLGKQAWEIFELKFCNGFFSLWKQTVCFETLSFLSSRSIQLSKRLRRVQRSDWKVWSSRLIPDFNSTRSFRIYPEIGPFWLGTLEENYSERENASGPYMVHFAIVWPWTCFFKKPGSGAPTPKLFTVTSRLERTRQEFHQRWMTTFRRSTKNLRYFCCISVPMRYLTLFGRWCSWTCNSSN